MPINKGFLYLQVSIFFAAASCSTALANQPIITEAPPFSDTLMEFSLSAPKADDGQDGQSYEGRTASNGASSGSDGRDGRDGHDGEDVYDAENGHSGRLLVEQAAAGILTFSGSFVGTQGQSLRAELRNSGFFRVVSRGGNGAMPGYGGWGENGGNGARGRNGVGRQRGGDGGDGGHGGDPGRGHDGSAAGDGGTVRVGIPANQLELAWVIEALAPGGLGGTHSEHGVPGTGGSGGAGGTGGTYWETETYYVTTRDSDGNTRRERRTRRVMRKMPDGSRGSSGRNGTRISTFLQDGADGREGEVIWEVLNSEGQILSETNNRFQLQVVGFSIEDYNSGNGSDGIFEPGERGFITNLFIRNNGDIPTPSGVKTRLKIKKGAYFYSDDVFFDVPEELAPGEVRLIKGSDEEALRIPIQVKDFGLRSPETEHFVRAERIIPIGYADVAGVERQIPEFNLLPEGIRDFTVQFPILIEPITALPNLARGEASKYIFRVTNISGRDFGSNSELKRHLELYIQRSGGDVPEDGIEFFDKEGNPLDINHGILKAVSNLGANESTIIETIVGVSPATESYRSAVTTVDLNIDRNGHSQGEDLHTVQRRVMTLNISDDYFKTPDSDFLLVTNSMLTRPGYEAWKNLIQDKLKTDIDIWDISYKNFIRFIEKLGEYNQRSSGDSAYDEFRTSLGEDFRGKTIILMANEFETSDGDGDSSNNTRSIWDYINLRDLRSACAIYDINLYIIGEGDDSKLADLYSPRRLEGVNVEYSTFSEIRDAADYGLDPVNMEAVEGSHYWETGLGSTISSWRFFTQPSESLAKRRARQLYESAIRENPDADFVTVHRFDPSRTRPIGFSFTLFGREIRPFGSTWEVGKVELWRSMGAEMGNVVIQPLPDWEVIGPNFANSQQNLANLYLSRSFKENLNDFEHYLSQYEDLSEGQKDALPVLIETIEKQLVLEQVKLRHRITWMPSSGSELLERLSNLRALADLNFRFTPDLPPEVINMVSDMLLDVFEYSNGQRKWWERYLLINGTRNARIARESTRVLSEIFKDFYSGIMDRRGIRAHFKAILRLKREALQNQREQGESWSELTLRAADIDNLVDLIPEYRGVVSGVDFDSRQARLEANDLGNDELGEEMVEQRGELTVPNPMLDRLNMGSRPLTCGDLLQ